MRQRCPSIVLLALVSCGVGAGASGVSLAQAQAVEEPAPAREATAPVRARRLPGYLEPHERPDGTRLVPAPPRPGSKGHAADLEVHESMRPLRDTARWRLAAADADVQFPHAASTFACALGVDVSAERTPALYELLQRSMVDAGQSTAAAKDKYDRARPFAVLGTPTCVTDDLAALRRSGAYPSGHAAAGWAWALILAELAPDRAGDVLRRGYEFGLSRVVCGVHWLSDVEAGRTLGAAAVARLHAEPEFVGRLQAAREELARARAAGVPPARDCAAEARALEATAAW